MVYVLQLSYEEKQKLRFQSFFATSVALRTPETACFWKFFQPTTSILIYLLFDNLSRLVNLSSV
jgi:hypothetical protein